jgi:hypothetical protein
MQVSALQTWRKPHADAARRCSSCRYHLARVARGAHVPQRTGRGVICPRATNTDEKLKETMADLDAILGIKEEEVKANEVEVGPAWHSWHGCMDTLHVWLQPDWP